MTCSRSHTHRCIFHHLLIQQMLTELLFFFLSIVDLQCVSFSKVSFTSKVIQLWLNVSHSVVSFVTSMDCSPPGSSAHGILQARILEWAGILFSRGSFQPRDQTYIPCMYVCVCVCVCVCMHILFQTNLHYRLLQIFTISPHYIAGPGLSILFILVYIC